MSKKTIIIICLLILALVLYLTSLVLTKKQPTNTTNILLSPTIAPFPTPTFILSPEDMIKIKAQQKGDLEFGKWQLEVNNNYSWYNKLPLQTDKYFVYFDLEQKQFFAQIYAIDEVALIKTEIFNTLKSYGVEADKYQFKWEIK